MRHSVSIRQLGSTYGDAWLNVGNCQTNIRVWGTSFQQPTYLFIERHTYELIVFPDRAWAAEALREEAQYYHIVWRLGQDKLTLIKGRSVPHEP